MDLKDVKLLIIGFRFDKAFRLGDILGQIIDHILNDSSSPFDAQYFPQITELGNQDRTLHHPETGCFLKLTPSDIIYRHSIPSEKTNFNNEFKWFKEDAVAFLVEGVLDYFKIRNIHRIGMMYSHIIELKSFASSILSKVMVEPKDDTPNADQFILTFGNKDVTAEGLIKKNVNDYLSRITSIKQIVNDSYDITLDYQYYFNPKCSTCGEWKINTFIDASLSHLSNKFYPLIDSFLPFPVANK